MSRPFFHAKLLLGLSIYYFSGVFGREAVSVVKDIEFEAQKSRHILHHKGRRRSALLDFDVMSFGARADGQTDDTRICDSRFLLELHGAVSLLTRLLRDTNGEWLKGFARAIGITTSAAAELWALRDGIRLCIALKIPAVIIELDAKIVVDLLQKEGCNQNGIDAILGDCRAGLREIPRVQIKHCYREANKCADALARRGALLPQDFVIFLEPPSDVALLISLDKAGVSTDRIVNVSNVDAV